MPAVPACSIQPRSDGRGRRGPFGWSCEPDGPGSARLRLRGELDLAGVEELCDALLLAEGLDRALTVDLADLDFIDCAATACLFRVAVRLSRAGRTLALVGDRGQVARLFDLTGIPPGAERRGERPRLSLLSAIDPSVAATAPRKGVRDGL